MLWEMVSGAADMEEDEGRMKAAAAWAQCERREGLWKGGGDFQVTDVCWGKELSAPGRGSRLGGRSRIWIQGFCTGASQGMMLWWRSCRIPALNLILASPLL